MSTKQPIKKQAPVRRKHRLFAGDDEQTASRVDVFQFLDHSRSTNSSRLSLPGAPRNVAPPSVASSALPQEFEFPTQQSKAVQGDSSARSIHSDSGISIRDSSPDPSSRRGSELDVVLEESAAKHPSLSAHRTMSRFILPGTLVESSESEEESMNEAAEYASEEQEEEPESFYRRAFSRQSNSAIGPDTQSSSPKPISISQADYGGYDLLAHRLSSAENPALYRRFEWLHHRMLLYLQDEIAELEEELKVLDRWDSESRAAAERSSQGQRVPSSRRMDWKYRGSLELCARRVDVMEKVQAKLRKYDDALQTYHRLQNQLLPANENLVSDFRLWMDKHCPIAESESLFLDHSDDLVTASRHLDYTSPASGKQPVLQLVVMTAAGSIILPLLAFSVIPNYLPRVCVASVMTLALLRLFETDQLRMLMRPAELKTCSLAYFGVMILAAFLIT